MEEIEIENVAKRSIRGIVALVYRTFTIQIIGLVANFLLTVFLSPSIFGIFFVVSAAIAFLSYFSDIGLAAALIQKKEAITDEELRTTFTIQQILVVSVVIIAFFSSGFVKSFYRLDDQGILLFQALVVSFFLSSLKTIPSIILERNLRFEKLVVPQIVENLLFYVIAVVLAAKGFGVASFTFAVLARGISGAITIYIINPWRIGFGFQKETAKRLLSFGLPFQTNSVLALIKDDLLIVYLGRVLPLAQVGYIGFAQKWAFAPLRLIMDNVIRVTFPSFSRLQHDKNVLGKAVEKSIFAACFLIFPIAFNAFVKGVEIEDKAAFIAKKERERIAGSPLMSFGIRCIKYGARTTSPIREGKIRKLAANIDFSIAFVKTSLSFCNLEKDGKVTLITLSIISLKGVNAHFWAKPI